MHQHTLTVYKYINNSYCQCVQIKSKYNSVKIIEKDGAFLDGVGKTAIDAVEKFVFGKIYQPKEVAQMKEQWEELKDGDTEPE